MLLEKPTNAVALIQGEHHLTEIELAAQVKERKAWLAQLGVKSVAVLMDNCVEWVLFDLACMELNLCLLPLPTFFSPAQINHALTQAGIEYLISDSNNRTFDIQGESDATVAWVPTSFSNVFYTKLLLNNHAILPEGTAKITFTSGSTGAPKGVCLSKDSMFNVAKGLAEATGIDGPTHLCLLPLSTLLENIAGIYAPLLVNGRVVLASEEERGFVGSRLLHPERMLQLISNTQPNSIILVPELLMFLVGACASGWQAPTSLVYIAVGGAKVAPELLVKARALGLPVYQGYGLSECSSVVAINAPGSEPTDFVGKPLPGQSVTIENNQIVAHRNLFLGYVNDPDSFYPEKVYTGDLGELTDDGLAVSGRIKNLIINSFGRNINPEWVESALIATGLFSHVVVFGESQPACIALLALRDPALEPQVEAALMMINSSLPDYAQIKGWHLIPPLNTMPQLMTDTGKVKRNAVFEHYQPVIDDIYKSMKSLEKGA